jgi:DNA modification methylase
MTNSKKNTQQVSAPDAPAREVAAEWVPIDELHVWKDNPRKNDGAPVKKVAESIHRFGFASPIIARRNGEIIAGHTRYKAAKQLKLDRVPVRFLDLEPDDAHLLAIADNRTAQEAEWDDDVLKAVLGQLESQGADLAATGFDAKELEALLADVDGDADKDGEVIEPPVDPITKPGDLWLLGEHRVLCGDSTKAENVERLMAGAKARLVITDPPYGVDYQGGTTKREKLKGDHDAGLYLPILQLANQFSDDECAVYLWHSDSKSAAVSAAVSAAGYELRCTIIWNKNIAQFGALGAQYKTKHEPCHYLYKKSRSPRWFGPTNEVTVWDISRNSKNEHHPTEKPVAVMARPMGNSSEKGDAVLDLFLGSGTTLIAAEQLGRKCYGMEISPQYCDVIVRRWETMTGQTAVREPAVAEA